MPNETKQAVNWALNQQFETESGDLEPIRDESGYVNKHMLVHFVRQYFNDNNIEYNSFSYYDLLPFLN